MKAERIASLLASGTEILYELGLGHRLVAVSHECDYPADAALKPRVTRACLDAQACSRAIDEQVKTVVAAQMPLYEVDFERLAVLKPNLIITQSHCEVCAVSLDSVMTAVQSDTRLKDARVVAMNPTTLRAVYEDIHSVGAAAGLPEEAKRYVDRLDNRVDAIAEITRFLSPAQRPRVVCLEWLDPVMAAANWMPDLIALAGGVNGLTRAGVRSAYTDWSQVQTYNPEVIILMPCGFDLARTEHEAAVLRKLPGWRELAAVRAGRVYAVDGNAYFNRSGPRLIDSLEVLAHLLHPDLFPDYAKVRQAPQPVWRPWA